MTVNNPEMKENWLYSDEKIYSNLCSSFLLSKDERKKVRKKEERNEKKREKAITQMKLEVRDNTISKWAARVSNDRAWLSLANHPKFTGYLFLWCSLYSWANKWLSASTLWRPVILSWLKTAEVDVTSYDATLLRQHRYWTSRRTRCKVQSVFLWFVT